MSLITYCDEITRKYGPLAARILIAFPFLVGGLMKLQSPEMTAGYMTSAGMPMADLLVWVAIAIEILGGLALIVGYKSKHAANVLIIFVIIATGIFHTNLSDPLQMAMFTKNLAILGALILIAAYGPGPLSFDKKQ